MRPEIRLSMKRPDGHPDGHSTISADIMVVGDEVTPAILDAAEDLRHTIETGEHALPKDLYDTCARAFGTSRDDAKKRLLAAIYGKASTPEPLLIGWTWRAHLDDLYAEIRGGHWLRAVEEALADARPCARRGPRDRGEGFMSTSSRRVP